MSGIGSYQYDANGNMTSRPTSSGTQTLAWNHENRLLSVAGGGASTSVYTYDDMGQRIKKTQGNKVSYYYNQYYEVETNGGVRGASLSLDDVDNPEGNVYPDEAPLDPSYDPPVVDDLPNAKDIVEATEPNPNLTGAAYLPIISGVGTGITEE